MEYKWILTNVHEQKSHIISNNTLVGTKNCCEIKLYGTQVTENDIRFKPRENKYITMKILRKDIKEINIKLNNRPIPEEAFSVHLYNNNYLSIESYVFRVTKIKVENGLTQKGFLILLKKLTKEIVQKFRNSQKNIKSEKVIAKITPNEPALMGKYVDGKMIVTNPDEEWEGIDLTL